MTIRGYSVFPVEHCWKLYNQHEGDQSFACRETVVVAGEGVARTALAYGVDAELYIREERGDFQRAPAASLGQ